MNTKLLSISLALITSLLVACGGGGDARSPDRPAPHLDPTSLRIHFPLGSQLAGTGSNSIPVQMLALQSDGVESNLGPELNVTAGTAWELGGSIGNPAIASLADAVRDAGPLRDVLDILSTVRLASTDPTQNLTITGRYNFSGTSYKLTSDFTIVPPVTVGSKYLNGQTNFAFNPSNSGATLPASYQLLQNLKEPAGATENTTNSVKFCSDSSHLVFSGPQPPTGLSAPATITNPFDGSDQSQISFKIFAIDPAKDCSDPDATKIADKIINLIPATVSKVAVCAVANPAADTCSGLTNSTVFFNKAKYLNNCKGLDNATVKVPAAQRLQLVAELTYTNPTNPNQTPLIEYQCTGPNVLAWSAAPTTIFSEGPDEDDGDASLISQADFEATPVADRKSTITGTYTNDAGTTLATTISDSVDLELVNAEVKSISIVRADGTTPPPGTNDKIYLDVFNEGIDYIAMCTFIDFDATDTIACPATFVTWSVNIPTTLSVNPAANSNSTTLSPVQDTTGEGVVQLTAKYQDNVSNVSTTRNIDTVNDEVVSLHLYQVSNANSPDEISIDEFSCVGRDDLVGSLGNGGTFIRGSQQFKAYALFESGQETVTDAHIANPKLAGSPLVDVTKRKALIFSAQPGYWSGNASANPSCVTSALPTGELPGVDQIPGIDQIPGLDGLPAPSSTPAASFSSEPNEEGYLKSRGLLRLSTVCVQAFIDTEDDGFTEEVDVLSTEGSTVLVLPVADDNLLTYSNELCEILEPVLTLGSNVPGLETGLVLPLIYTVSTIADPILATLATNDDGGQIPAEEIIEALITGEFSAISPELPDSPIGGLGQVTEALLGDGSVLSPVINALDACLLDPVTSSVGTLLNGILGLSPDSFAELTNISFEDCQTLLGDFLPAP